MFSFTSSLTKSTDGILWKWEVWRQPSLDFLEDTVTLTSVCVITLPLEIGDKVELSGIRYRECQGHNILNNVRLLILPFYPPPIEFTKH